MNLTAAAIRRSRVTAAVVFVLVLAGAMTYQNMPRQTDPGFIIRVAQIVTFFPGASPDRVEQLVTDKLEKVVQELPQLDFVVSDSRTGLSVVLVRVKDAYTDMRPIWDRLRRKVDRVRPELPDGIIGPTVDDEFGDVYGIMFTVSSNGADFTDAELKDAADDIRDELLRIEGDDLVPMRGECGLQVPDHDLGLAGSRQSGDRHQPGPAEDGARRLLHLRRPVVAEPRAGWIGRDRPGQRTVGGAEPEGPKRWLGRGRRL